MAWYFDNAAKWRKAETPEERRGWSGQRVALFFSNQDLWPTQTIPVFVHDTFTYKEGYIAETDWEQVLGKLEPFLFLPSDTISYEIFAAERFWDPLVEADLRLKENRTTPIKGPGASGTSLTIWRLGGKMHELKRPILTSFDHSLLETFVDKYGTDPTARMRYLVDENGNPSEIEIIESTSEEIAKAAEAYIRSMRFEPGYFDGRRATYRVTQVFAFDSQGELIESDGTEMFR